MDLVHDIVDAGRFAFGSGLGLGVNASILDPSAAPMSRERIDKVLARELQERALPAPPAYEPEGEELCQCPTCRRKRRSTFRQNRQLDLFDDFLEYDEGDLEEENVLPDFGTLGDLEDFDPFEDDLPLPPELAGMSPELLAAMLEVSAKFGNRKGELPNLEVIRRRDPELFSRLEEAYLRQEVGAALDASFEPPLKRRGRSSGKRKKRRKGKRR
jgi:hypothetical protein